MRAKLSEGGTLRMALHEAFWGACFGVLTDKFGIDWLLNCERAKKYCVRALAARGQRQIGRQFGVSPHAVSKAIAQTAALRREGGKVARALERLISTFRGCPPTRATQGQKLIPKSPNFIACASPFPADVIRSMLRKGNACR